MASSGPTSATDRNGERCQSTTSISAAEAIKENGTIVQRTFERASAKSERCELTATTAVIRIRFTPYWAEAAAPTRARTPPAPSPCSGDEAAPAAVAASASTETLYTTRIGGRCSRSWVTAGARKTTSRPAAQPKRTIEATPKTNESETPPVSTPSTGTGKRSASVEARSSAARPSSVVVLCGVTAKDTTAAEVTPRPAAHTGTSTARSRGGGKTRRVMSRLPVQVVVDLDAEAAERDENERENGGDDNESRLPVQHVKPPPRLLCRTPPIVEVVGPGGIPRKGEPQALPGALEAGFGKRTPTPGELLAVPADERSHCDALSRGVDHPDAAEVDPGMPDRRRPGAGAGGAEEEHVAGLQLGEADPPRARHFTAHLVRCPAFDGRRQRCAAGVRLQLVDAPDEAGAVEATGRLDAERRLWLLARAAPDVGEADEAQDPRGGVRGLGARDRVARKELEVVLGRRVVRAQAEQARDRLGAEA